MKKTYLIILLLLFCGSIHSAIGRAKIEGYVFDAKTKQPIAGATVQAREARKGVTTNEKGYYSMILPIGSYTLAVTSVSHRLKVQSIQLVDDTTIDFFLDESARDLDEVTITGKSAEDNLKSSEMSVIKLSIQGIKKIPIVFGEADIIKALMLQPGISTVGEGAGGFNVRGGRVDQNLVLLDNIPLFNTSHLLGFFSNVNPDVIQDVTLYKAGVPASYGGRLSSLLTMNTKNGNDEEVRFSWGIGPVTARVLAEGPIIKNKLTFLVGARGAYPNYLIKAFPGSYGKSRAAFYDANAKLQYKFNQNNRLTISAYRSYDNFKFDEDTLYSWHTTAVSAAFSSAISKNLSLNLSATNTFFEFGLNGQQQTLEYRITNSIHQQEAKIGFLFTPTETHKIEWGGNYIEYELDPANRVPTTNGSSVNALKLENEYAREMAGFVSNDWTITPQISLHVGARYSYFQNVGPKTVRTYEVGVPRSNESVVSETRTASGEVIQSYGGIEPRAALKIGVSGNASVKLSYNRMRQYLHLISNTTAISPIDFWKVSDRHIQPQVGDQYAIGVFKNFDDNTIETSIEAYYKDIQNMVEYKNGAMLLLNSHIETDLLNAKGKAYGVEFAVKKNKGKLTGQASYTFSRTYARVITAFPIELVNGGNWFPSTYDRPHVFNGSASLQIGKGWSLASNYTYQTGRPTTYPDGQFIYNASLVNNFSKRNLDRLPAYHRLDVSITKDTRKLKEQKRYSTWNFSLYNLYGRRNPYSIYFTRYNLGTNSYRLSVLGSVIPSLTLNFYY